MDELIARHCDLKTTPTDVLRCRQLCQDCAATAIRSATAEIARLREALRYYADEDNKYPNEGPWGTHSEDWGKVARAALKGEP